MAKADSETAYEEDPDALLKAVSGLTDTYNALSSAFLKFALAYASVSEQVRILNENQPTLFTQEKD